MKPKYQIEFTEEGHTYTYEGKQVPCVSDILEYFGITNFDSVRSSILQASMDFGNVVHKTLELYDKNDLLSCDLEIEAYLDGWKKFRKECLDENRPFEVIEQSLYSKVWGYAGTPDRVYNASLFDIKTGSINVSHPLQTAFYQILVEENFPIKIRKRYSIFLKPCTYALIPRRYMIPDEKLIGGTVRLNKGATVIEGIEVYCEESVKVRTK